MGKGNDFDRAALVNPTGIPEVLYPTDDIRVWIKPPPNMTIHKARYLLTAAGRVYRDDGRPCRLWNNVLTIAEKTSRSVPRLMVRYFGPRVFTLSRTERVVLVPTVQRIDLGRLIDIPLLDDADAELREEALELDRKAWVAQVRDSPDYPWRVKLTVRKKPEWWVAWTDPDAPIDPVTGATRSSVYDVGLVSVSEVTRIGRWKLKPERVAWLVKPSRRVAFADPVPQLERPEY